MLSEIASNQDEAAGIMTVDSGLISPPDKDQQDLLKLPSSPTLEQTEQTVEHDVAPTGNVVNSCNSVAETSTLGLIHKTYSNGSVAEVSSNLDFSKLAMVQE